MRLWTDINLSSRSTGYQDLGGRRALPIADGVVSSHHLRHVANDNPPLGRVGPRPVRAATLSLEKIWILLNLPYLLNDPRSGFPHGSHPQYNATGSTISVVLMEIEAICRI